MEVSQQVVHREKYLDTKNQLRLFFIHLKEAQEHYIQEFQLLLFEKENDILLGIHVPSRQEVHFQV